MHVHLENHFGPTLHVSQGCPQQSELRQMASKTRVRNSSRIEAPAFCEKDQSQKQANDLILGQGRASSITSLPLYLPPSVPLPRSLHIYILYKHV